MISAYVDANVILRFLLNDPPAMAEEAALLFQAVADDKVILIVDDIILAETVWVLKSYYHHTVTEIASTLRDFLLQEGIEAPDKPSLLQALSLFEVKNVDFVDAMVAVRMQRHNIPHVFSFDMHFNRLPGVQRVSPGDVSLLGV